MYILRRGNEFQMTIFTEERQRRGKSAGRTHAQYLYDRKIDDIVLQVVRIDGVTITTAPVMPKDFREADDFSLLTVDYAP